MCVMAARERHSNQYRRASYCSFGGNSCVGFSTKIKHFAKFRKNLNL